MRKDGKEVVDGRCVDDCCLFCGLHPDGGGHYYKGWKDKNGFVHMKCSDGEWIVFEHIAYCCIWICPECAKKVKHVFRYSWEDGDEASSE